MGFMDKITGRVKQAMGDLAGDPATRREGLDEERKAQAEEELAREREAAEARAREVADLERRTS